MAGGLSPAEIRIVLLGSIGAGKSKLARLLIGGKEPKGESGLCILRKGESAGKKICLVDTPGWHHNSINRTSENIKNEIIRSATLCPPGPHALVVVLRIRNPAEVPSVKELKTVSQHMELLSKRVWKHAMVLFLCDEKVEKAIIEEHIQKASRLLEKCGNRYYTLCSEEDVPEFLEEIQKMVEGNCGDFFLPEVYYEYMQSQIPKDISDMKKMYEEREERLKQGYQANISEYKKQAGAAVHGQRRGSISQGRPNLNEKDQEMNIAEIKSKNRDELLELARSYLKPVAVIVLAMIGALVGSVVGSTYGVMGSGVGIVVGICVTIPLALWLIGAASLARQSSNLLQEKLHNT